MMLSPHYMIVENRLGTCRGKTKRLLQRTHFKHYCAVFSHLTSTGSRRFVWWRKNFGVWYNWHWTVDKRLIIYLFSNYGWMQRLRHFLQKSFSPQLNSLLTKQLVGFVLFVLFICKLFNLTLNMILDSSKTSDNDFLFCTSDLI